MTSSHDTRAGRRRNHLEEQWFALPRSMLEHPAFRVLSQSAYRVLFRIALELRKHGGHDNGKLPITYDDFENYGVHRHSIAPAIRELVALGFIKVKLGRPSAVEYKRTPSLYRLTCESSDVEMSETELQQVTMDNDRHSYATRIPTKVAPTNDWKGRADTMVQAARLAEQARRKPLVRRKTLVVDSANTVVADSATGRRHLSVRIPPLQAWQKPPLLSRVSQPLVDLNDAVWTSTTTRLFSVMLSSVSLTMVCANIGVPVSKPLMNLKMTRACRRSAAMIMMVPTSPGPRYGRHADCGLS